MFSALIYACVCVLQNTCFPSSVWCFSKTTNVRLDATESINTSILSMATAHVETTLCHNMRNCYTEKNLSKINCWRMRKKSPWMRAREHERLIAVNENIHTLIFNAKQHHGSWQIFAIYSWSLDSRSRMQTALSLHISDPYEFLI